MRQRGFTLIELLVVIAILGLLSTLAVIALGSARERSRDTLRVAHIRQMQSVLELYFVDHNAFPRGTNVVFGVGNYKIICDDGVDGDGFAATTKECVGRVYLDSVPSNPAPGGAAYTYTAEAPFATYALTTRLEGTFGGTLQGQIVATPAGLK